MQTREGRAPSYNELRPLKGETDTFPVYKGLADHLVRDRARPYDEVARHVCAVASGWAYAEADTAAMMVARLGLEENRYLEASICNDAMFIASHALLIQSKCGRVVILCYRGTEPRNFINWLTDADVNPVKAPVAIETSPDPKALVHGGFYRNLRATWHEVLAGLRRAAGGLPIDERESGSVDSPLQALYVTGHSLGAAMAALAGVWLLTDPVYHGPFGTKVRGIYTYGQPMLGTPEFAHACDENAALHSLTFRHIYEHDVVPRLPPTATGIFRHFGQEFRTQRSDKDERLTWVQSAEAVDQVPDLLLATVVIPVLAFAGKQLEKVRNVPFPYSWYDHLPSFYIDASTPQGVRSEFER